MNKRKDFKQRRFRWLIMLLLAVFIATGGISSTATAAPNNIWVEGGGGTVSTITDVSIDGANNITGANTITANGGVSTLAGINNNSGGITNTGAISNVTTLSVNLGSTLHGINNSGSGISNAGAISGVSTLAVAGDTTLGSSTADDVIINGTISSSVGPVLIGDNLSVNGATDMYGQLRMHGYSILNVNNLTTLGSTTLGNDAADTTTVSGNLTANGTTNQIGVYANSTNNIFGTLNQISSSTENYIGSEGLNVITAPNNYIYGATTLDSTPGTGGGNTLTVAGTGIQANVTDGTNNAVFGLGALPGGFSSYGTGAYIAYNNTATLTAYGLFADDRSVNVGYLSYNPIAAPVYHGLQVTDTETTLSGGTNSSNIYLADSQLTLAVGTASTSEVTVFTATNNGSSTSVTISGDYNQILGDTNEITSTNYGSGTGGTNVRVTDGSFRVNSYDQNGTDYPETTFQVGAAGMRMMSDNDNDGVMRMIMNSNSGNADMSYSYGDRYTGLYFDDGDITVGVEDSFNNTAAGLDAWSTGARAGFADYSDGIFSGLYASNSSTSVSYSNFDSSPLVFGMYADSSSATFGYTDFSSGADHGLGVYADHTVLSGGTNSSSLTLADETATLAVGTASTSEITVLTATNDGAATAINISSNSFNVDTNNTNGVVIPNVAGTGVLSVADGNTYIGNIDQTLSYVNGLVTNDNSATLRGGGSSGSTAMTLDGTGATITGASGTTFEVDNLGNTTMGIDATTTATINGALLVDSNGTAAGGGNTFAVASSGIQANVTDGSNNAVFGLGALPAPYGAYGSGAYIGYVNTNTSTVYGLFADGNAVNVGYLNAGGYEGLQVENSHTTLTGGSNSSSLTLANATATLAVGTASTSEVTVLTASNNGSTTDVNISSDTLTVDAATTINNTLEVDSNGAAAGGNRLSVNTTNITLTSNSGSEIIVGNTANGVRSVSANHLERVGVNNDGSYIGYFDSANLTTGNLVTGLEADADGVTVAYNYGDGSAYGLMAEDGAAYVGYYNGTTDIFHGLTVNSTQTTLTGGTNSSSLTLADGSATLAVGTASSSEVTVLTATNSGTATDVNIGSDTLTVDAATTINNSLLVDSNGTATAGGNTLSVNSSGVSARSDSGSFGMDVKNSVAQIGFSDGTTTNGIAATSSNVAVSSYNATLDSATLSLAVGDEAYISYYDSSNKTEYGLSADDTRATVGSINYNTGDTYGMTATNNSVFVGSVIGGVSHGLTVDGTTNTTTLSGGTNSSSWTLADSSATLAVGTASSSGIDLISATNDGTDTNVTIGDTASGNYFEVDSADGATVHGDLTVTGNLTVNGTTFSGDDISTNGDLTVAGNTTTNALSVTNDASIGGNLTVGGDTNLNGALSVSDAGPNYFSALDVNGTTGVNAYAFDPISGGAAGMGAGISPFLPSGTSAYIGYTTNPFGGGTMYGLQADGNGVGVGYFNTSTGASHGLYVTNTQTTLSGGTNSSSLTLADSSATLAVGTASSSEVTVLTASNNGSTTDVNISSTTLTVGAATTINNTLHVTGNTDLDSNLNVDGNTTMGGTLDVTGATHLYNTLTVDGNTTLNNNLSVDSNGAAAGGQQFVVNDTRIRATSGAAELILDHGAASLEGNTVEIDGANSTLIEGGSSSLTLNNTGAAIIGNTDITGTLHVTGNSYLDGNVYVDQNLDVDGTLNVDGAATFNNTLTVQGVTTLNDDLLVDSNGAAAGGNTFVVNDTAIAATAGAAQLNLDSTTGAASLAGTDVTVTGTNSTNIVGGTSNILLNNSGVTVNGVLNVQNNAYFQQNVDIDGNLNVEGNSYLDGNVYIDQNLDVDGTLDVDGAATLNNTLTVQGVTTLNDDLLVDSNGAAAGGNTFVVNDSAVTATAGTAQLSLASATGAASLQGTDVTIDGANSTFIEGGSSSITLDNNGVAVVGNTDIDGTLSVQHNAYFQQNVDIDGNLNVEGNSYLDGNVYIDQNLDVDGALNVDGPTTLNNTLTVQGVTTLNNYLYVDSNGAAAGGNTFIVDDTSIAASAGAAQLSLNSTTGAASLVGTDVTIDGANSTHIEGGSSSITLDDNGVAVVGNTDIDGTLSVQHNAYFQQNVDIDGNLNVEGNSYLDGNVYIDQNLDVDGTINVDGAATLNNTLTVAGATVLNSTLTVAGATTINNTLHVTGNTTLDSDLHVGGDTVMDGSLQVFGTTTLHDDLNVVGLTTTHGIVNTGDITTDTLTTTGNATIGGNLSVAGNETIAGTLAVTGMTSTHGITNTGSLTSNGGDVVLSTNSGNPGNASLRLTDDSSASLLYTNVSGNTHGLTVGESSTVLTGGTTSTSLTLNDGGATFANSSTGNPVRVTGIANGVNDYDAVNVRQLRVYEDAVDKANIGIASVSALAAIPGTMPCKRFAVGAGYGYFEHESAIAIGIKARMWDFLSVQAGIGFGVDSNDDSSYSANAGISYSF
jgi:predicted acyltransferase (DUF342 family)